MPRRHLHLHIRRLVLPAEALPDGARPAQEFADALEQALSLRLCGTRAGDPARRAGMADAVAEAVLRQSAGNGPKAGGGGRR